MFELIKSKRGLALMFIQFVRGALVQCPTLWLATFLFSLGSFPLTLAGIAVAFYSLLGVPSAVVGGAWSDRMESRMSVAVVSSGVLAVAFVALGLTRAPALLWGLIACIGWFVVLYRPALFAILPELYGKESFGLSVGLHNTAANLGGVVFTFTLGLLRDLTGSFATGWLILGVLSAIALIPAVLMRRIKSPEVSSS